MKNKNKRNEYKTIPQFISNLNLMVFNSTMYNEESHDVTLLSHKIRALAMNKLSEHGDKLKELNENDVQIR